MTITIWLNENFEPVDQDQATIGKVLDGDEVYFIAPGKPTKEFGGPGSGFYGHAGRDAENLRGGSVARGEGGASDDEADKARKQKAESMAHGLIDQLQNGGSSESTEGKHPPSGYMTATSPKTEKKIAIENLTEDDLKDYIIDNYAGLLQDDVYLGGWLDTDEATGKTYAYLDVSTNYQGLEETIKVARGASQIGIYDVVNGRTIYVNDPSGKLYYLTGPKGQEKKVWMD